MSFLLQLVPVTELPKNNCIDMYSYRMKKLSNKFYFKEMMSQAKGSLVEGGGGGAEQYS